MKRLSREVATLSATPRHMNHSLWLLPSGPDQINELSLRGNQQGHHNVNERIMHKPRLRVKPV